MSGLLNTLNGFFARPKKAPPKTRLIATDGDWEFEIARPTTGRKFYHVRINGDMFANSILGDLESQLNDIGWRIERRPV